MSEKYPCPCCEYLTYDASPPGTDEMCPVCGWEDDEVQFKNPFLESGVNGLSLDQARSNFLKIGVISENLLPEVRKPYEDEIPSS